MAFSALQALQVFGAGREMAYQDQERARTAHSRAAMSDYIMARSQPTGQYTPGQMSMSSPAAQISAPSLAAVPPPTTSMGVDTTHTSGTPASAAPGGDAISRLVQLGQPPMARRNPAADAAYQRLAQADPRQALEVQSLYQQMDDRDLRFQSRLNDAALQMLSGVHDQASMDNALVRARQLWVRMGLDPAELDSLPRAYTPETIDGIRIELMTASQQLSAARLDRRLAWDIEDDEADNDRADRSLTALVEHRREQRALTARGQDRTDSRFDRAEAGRNRRAAGAEAGRDRRATGAEAGRDRRAAMRPNRGGGGGGNAARAILRGRPIVVRNNQWVFEDTGQPAQ